MTAKTSCQYGVTGWCGSDRHDRCPYRPDGQLTQGVWLPECYVLVGHGPKAHGLQREVVAVIKPSHLYRCPCECHATQQLELFGVAS